MLFIGDDWAEGHHDVAVQDESGKTLARRRLPEGADGIARFHELVASRSGGDGEPDPAQVVRSGFEAAPANVAIEVRDAAGPRQYQGRHVVGVDAVGREALRAVARPQDRLEPRQRI